MRTVKLKNSDKTVGETTLGKSDVITTIAGLSDFEWISTTDVKTNTSSFEFKNLSISTYSSYKIVISNMGVAGNGSVALRFITFNTEISTGYSYHRYSFGNAYNTGQGTQLAAPSGGWYNYSNSGTEHYIVGANTAGVIYAEIQVDMPPSAVFKAIYARGLGTFTNSPDAFVDSSGWLSNSSYVNGFKIYGPTFSKASSGGKSTITLYGRRYRAG